MGLRHILNRFEFASIKRMYENAKAVSKQANKNIILVLYDMMKCILKDNVGYMEYNLFHFVNKDEKLRKTYVTFNESQKLYKLLNNPNYVEIFNNKLLFNQKFKDYIKRDFLDSESSTYEDFKTFIQNKNNLFVKPKDSCSGKGIYKSYDLSKENDIEKLFNYFKENKLLIEDEIKQSDNMNKLNESSINTIRIVTVLKDEEVYVIYQILRIGRDQMKVDNVGSGGLYTILSCDGEIIYPCWSDKTIQTYVKHPDNGFDLIGFKIKDFDKAIELVKKAALVEPHIRYVGWDVAMSSDGPLLVEGNQLPGYDMPQNYFVNEKDEGILPVFEKILGKVEV